MKRLALLAVVASVACGGAEVGEEQPRRICMHSHNDYEHARPLFEALEAGACSVEADVHLVEGSLLVAHDVEDVSPSRTLAALYLDPLAARSESIQLLVDVKSEALPAYHALQALLAGYPGLKDGVTIVVSGNRAITAAAMDDARAIGIDGRIADLGGPLASDVMPVISDDWRDHFNWVGGVEAMPAAEKRKLRDFAARAHGEGRRLRFWGTFDLPEVWSELYDAEVDFIGTDDLAALSAFLAQRKSFK